MEHVSTNGHGGDKEPIPLVGSDSSYAFKYFRFTLIEHFFNIKKGNNDSIIIEREKYWKEALLTRKHGYNRN